MTRAADTTSCACRIRELVRHWSDNGGHAMAARPKHRFSVNSVLTPRGTRYAEVFCTSYWGRFACTRSRWGRAWWWDKFAHPPGHEGEGSGEGGKRMKDRSKERYGGGDGWMGGGNAEKKADAENERRWAELNAISGPTPQLRPIRRHSTALPKEGPVPQLPWLPGTCPS